MSICRVCKNESVQELIDFGLLPVSCNFLKKPTDQEFKNPFILGFCSRCAIVQQIKPFPVEKLRSIYSWTKYGEPEEHLDSVVEMLGCSLLKGKESKICGLTYKDSSLLQRMNAKGFSFTTILDPISDLSLSGEYGGVDIIQEKLSKEQALNIVNKKGKFDLIVARHILEHVYDFSKFFAAIKELLTPGGLILFEVPDYSKLFERFEYSALWEEHIVYFTPETYNQFFSLFGCSVFNFKNYENPLENCLVALIKTGSEKREFYFTEHVLIAERQRAFNFAQMFSLQKQLALNSILSNYTKDKKVVIFGAGHNSCFLINIFCLADYLEGVIDDNPQKIGKFMPGSKLPILPSSVLPHYDVCGLCINPNLELKVINEKNMFLDNGGKFISFSPVSPLSVFNDKNILQNSLEVLLTPEKIVSIGKDDLVVIKENALKSQKLRSRICIHKSSSDKLHEMLLTLQKGSYVRPHKHINKAESFHIIQGTGFIIIFDDESRIHDVTQLGDYNSGKIFYYRLDAPFYHMVIVTSDELVFHETTTGPFNKEDTIFPSWSPNEDDIREIKKFLEKMIFEASIFLNR